MAKQPLRQKSAGMATWVCDQHKTTQTVSWGAGYPPVQAPQCSHDGGHPMTLASDDDPAKSLEPVPEQPADARPKPPDGG